MDTDHHGKGEVAPVFVSIETSAYSGATLLAFLLGSHPRIATIGEMDGLIASENPDEYRCSCGERIRACEFWHAMEKMMQKQGHYFDVAQFGTKCEVGRWRLLHRLRVGSFRNNTVDLCRDWIFERLPGEARRLERLIERNSAFVKAVLNVSGKDIFVDSSKDRCRVRYLQRWSAMAIRMIHLVRDVRGVVASRLRRQPTRDIDKYAREWVKEHQRHERLRNYLQADRSVRIRYEDLCHNPQRSLRLLYSFLGVNGAVEVDFRTVPHHILGNGMRLKASASVIQLDRTWETMLTVNQLKTIDRVAGELNRKFGYD